MRISDWSSDVCSSDLPIIGVFFVMSRLLVTLNDEYQRYLLTRQMLIATGFMLSVATVWGFVESFGLLPHVPAFYAAILWFGGLGQIGRASCRERVCQYG